MSTNGDTSLRRRYTDKPKEDDFYNVGGSITSFFSSAYDSEKKELWGRTALSWGQILLFYFCFYTCLMLFNACVWFTWQRIIMNPDDAIYSADTGMAWTPGMQHLPIIDPERRSTLITYTRSNMTHINMIRENLYEFLAGYEPNEWTSENGNFIDCSQGRTDPDPEKVCEFKLDAIRPCIYEDDYGWFEGQPCIILKMNRINDWEPEPYESLEEVPEEIRDIYQPGFLPVKCFGMDPVSKEALGDVEYYPQAGFSFDYYPFIGQQGYKSPLVAVQFMSLPHRSLIFITCKAFSKNLVYDKNKFLGMTSFEIQSD